MKPPKSFKIYFYSSVVTLLIIAGGSSAFSAGESLQIVNVSPTGSINAGSTITFYAAANGFVDATFTLADSFSASGATTGVIDKFGYFTWTPGIYDAGRHNITVVASDAFNHSATSTASILVASNTIVINNLSPGPTVQLFKPVTFTVVAPGFVSPSYNIYSTYNHGSLNSSDINSSGSFSWTPIYDDIGVNTFTIVATDVYGHSAQTNETLTVINPAVSTTTTPTTATTPVNVVATPTVPQNNTATVNPILTKNYIFTTSLAIGSRGTAVIELQKRLTALGFFSGLPTGYFGSLTALSVKKFQSAHGISSIGTVGPATRTALNK